ncbi:MAG: alpha/beta hydrolase family protein, partial [Paramuribaculum sp.]|nr:alpha/beta hydrolase family protein [Paramuribaculum sp.]
MMNLKEFFAVLTLALWCALSAHASVGGDSLRSDGRALRSRGVVESLMRRNPPRLTFRPEAIDADSFKVWQGKMKQAMALLMRHPQAPSAAPRRVDSRQRAGYRIERWESYPIDSAVVPFLVLIPDGVDARHPAPAALCIPGFGQTKELLAGERAGNYSLEG